MIDFLNTTISKTFSSVFQFGFSINCRFSDSLSDRIARAFNRFGATLAGALDKSKALNRVVACMSLLLKLKPSSFFQ